MEMKFTFKFTVVLLALATVTILAGCTDESETSVQPGNLPSAAQTQPQAAEDQKILAQLKKIMLLPDDVIPTMAVITDVNVLMKQQPGFFANAKNGEHLIVYPDLAIIFDPETNQIIKTGGIQFVAPQGASQPSTPDKKGAPGK